MHRLEAANLYVFDELPHRAVECDEIGGKRMLFEGRSVAAEFVEKCLIWRISGGADVKAMPIRFP